MTDYRQVTLLDGSLADVNAEQVTLLLPVPADLLPIGVPDGTFIDTPGSGGDRVAVQGTVAAVAVILSAGGTMVLGTLLALDGSAVGAGPQTTILGAVPTELLPVGVPAGTYIDTPGAPGDRVAVQGTPAAVAALLNAGTGGSGTAALANCLWVNIGGNDATAQRGSLELRYATISGALAAALSGDTILVAPGNYAELAPLTIPVALTAISIVGLAGSATTRVLFPPATQGLVIPDAAGVVTIQGVSFVVGDNVRAMFVDSTTQALAGLVLRDVRTETGLASDAFQCNGAVGCIIEGCRFDAAVLIRSSTGVLRACTGEGLSVSRIPTDAFDAGPAPITLDGCTFIDLNLQDAVRLHTLANTTIQNQIDGTTLAVVGGSGPRIYLEGILGDVDQALGFTGDLALAGLPPADVTTLIIVRLRGGRAGATWTFAQPAGARTPIDADGSNPFPATTIVVNGEVDVSMRGVPTEALTLNPAVGTATLDRDSIALRAQAVIIGATALPFDPPLPNADYAVTAIGDTAAMDLIVTAKAAGGVTLTSAAVGNADAQIVRAP